MFAPSNQIVTEEMFREATGYFIGDEIPVRFKNIDDNQWHYYKVSAIWGLGCVGYSKPETLTTVIESNGAECAIMTKDVIEGMLKHQLEKAAENASALANRNDSWGKGQLPYFDDGSIEDRSGSKVAVGVIDTTVAPSTIYSFGYPSSLKVLGKLIGVGGVNTDSYVFDNSTRKTLGIVDSLR